MLVLSRQRDETIMIGDKIEITIVDVRGEKVRLGISAPTHISVHRKEVYDAITRENADASQLSGDELNNVRPPGEHAAAPERARGLVSATPARPEPAAPAAPTSTPAASPAVAAPHASETETGSARGLRRSA